MAAPISSFAPYADGYQSAAEATCMASGSAAARASLAKVFIMTLLYSFKPSAERRAPSPDGVW
ncbi:hypothetical protein D9M69_665650 [compost metagenome]